MMTACLAPAAPQEQTLPMFTHTGRRVLLLEPWHTEVVELDLHVALSRECRYGGHVPITVLEHLGLCVYLAELLHRNNMVTAYAAAHDLHEAYVKDIPAPMKELLPEYRAMELLWERHVHRHFGLAWPADREVQAAVRHIDLRASRVEMTVLGGPGYREIPKADPPSEKELLALKHVLGAPSDDVFGMVMNAIKRRYPT